MATDAMNYCTSCSLGHTIICFFAALILFISGMVTLGKKDDDCDDTVSYEIRGNLTREAAANLCEPDFFSLPNLLIAFSAIAFVIGLLLVCLTVKLNRNASRQIVKTTNNRSGTEAGVGRSNGMGPRMTHSAIGNGLRQNNNQRQNMRHPQVATISGGAQSSSSGFAMSQSRYFSEELGLPPPYSSVVSMETQPTEVFGYCSPSAPAMIDDGYGFSNNGGGLSSSGIGCSDSGGGFSSSNGGGYSDSGTGFSESGAGCSSSSGGGCSDSGGGCRSSDGVGYSSSDW